jgi:single-strand DNA-binding protein
MINRVVLVGRLTRDPDLRKTASGLAVASFTLAVDDSRKGPNGEKQTIFMNISIFGNSAENVAKYTRKGSLVGIEGRLTQRKYVRKTDNAQVTSTDIVADSVEFLDPKGASNAQSAQESGFTPDAGAKTPAAPATQVAPAKQEGKNLDSIDVVDDDLPF